MPVLGYGERAAGAGGNPGDLKVGHAGKSVHHARAELLVLAGVPKPPVPSAHAQRPTQTKKREDTAGGVGLSKEREGERDKKGRGGQERKGRNIIL